MTFEHLAADVVGLLDHLGIERADVFGFSLGGLTTYELLVHHQDRIRRAVVASADHRNDRGGEIHPERMRRRWSTDSEAGPTTNCAPSRCRYWLIGDTDFILVPDAADAAELLPHGQLAVLPATTHMDMTRSELVAPVVETFLRRDVRTRARAEVRR